MTIEERITALEKKVAGLERQLAERPSMNNVADKIIEKLRTSGVQIL
jgi:hypothetical protein